MKQFLFELPCKSSGGINLRFLYRGNCSKLLLFSTCLFVFICACASGNCEVSLPNVLSSHMVLQRDKPIHLWGWADPGERVTATLQSTSASTKAGELGKWSLYLPPEQAGGPYQITISGTNRIVLADVLIGDVWLASGQSNMELPLMGYPHTSYVVANSAAEIRNAANPDLRLLLIPKNPVLYPQQNQGASWTRCTPETAAKFSAVAYFFAREIASREHVPVGIIDSTYGGTPAGAWLSMDALGADASLMPVFAEWARFSDDYVDLPRVIAKENRDAAAARVAHRPAPWHPWHPNYDSWAPSSLFNGMISPLINYPIKGVIWYQGESDSELNRAAMYRRVFPAMISDWRRQWREGNFPFLYVQISSFLAGPTQNWAVIREAQRRTLSVANTAMVVTTDIGTPHNIHPPDKQDVGHRLALAARALAYGESVEYSGPLYRQTSVDGSQLRVWFDHAKSGLVSKGGSLTGFEVAGADHHFFPAKARIDGRSVVVSSPQVPVPEYVRFGWSNTPVVNLFNGAGLPASPFTSELDIPKP